MWFLFTILCILSWGAAEFFYKTGNDYDVEYSSSRTVVMVGFVMGIYVLIYNILIRHTQFHFSDIISYLPVSTSYILSMWLGYVGLRYLAVSIVGPVSNASGAVTAILLVIFAKQRLTFLAWLAIILVTVGLLMIGFTEHEEQEEVLAQETDERLKRKYKIGAIAIIFPVFYMIFDSLGTFFDGIVLDAHKMHIFGRNIYWELGEEQANMAYMLTFFFLGLIVFFWLKFVKKQKFVFFGKQGEAHRLGAAALETVGQVFYVPAMAGSAVIAAPLIASYAVISIVMGHVFLNERLTKWQYIAVLLVLVGTAIIGFYDF